jgi:hypothetical protein
MECANNCLNSETENISENAFKICIDKCGCKYTTGLNKDIDKSSLRIILLFTILTCLAILFFYNFKSLYKFVMRDIINRGINPASHDISDSKYDRLIDNENEELYSFYSK